MRFINNMLNCREVKIVGWIRKKTTTSKGRDQLRCLHGFSLTPFFHQKQNGKPLLFFILVMTAIAGSGQEEALREQQ